MESTVLRASEQFPVVIVTGPRQVGKTTLLKHLMEDSRRYVTLDSPFERNLANEDPELFLHRYEPPVLIDEIQYAPDLLHYIKIHVDENGIPGQFWLTGSQQFRLMKGVTESLAGRVAVLDLLGFSMREELGNHADPFLSSIIDTETRLIGMPACTVQEVFGRIWQGSFPAIVTERIQDWELFYSSYLQTYIERDIRDLTQVGDRSRFLRFLKACAARTGQLLNTSNLARDADVSVTTAKRWLGILETGRQIFLLEPYHSNLTKRLVKAPKLFFLDTGFAAYLTGWLTAETLMSGAMAGQMLETWVLVEILKSWWHCGRKPGLFFYRDKDGREVDFVFVRNQKLFPVEVKLGSTPKPEWQKGFRALYRLGKTKETGIILCFCREERFVSRDITALPVTVI